MNFHLDSLIMKSLTSLDKGLSAAPNCWYQLQVPSSSKPSGRVGHSLIYLPEENSLFCIGGANPRGLSKKFHKLNLDDLIWKEAPTTGFAFRYEHATFAPKISDRVCLFVFGGADTSQNRNDLQLWNYNEELWENVEALGEAPSPRTQHIGAASDNFFYVFGGGASESEPVPDRSVFVFDLHTHIWSCLETTGSPPCPRQGHCMVVVENKIYLHGGLNGEDFYDDFYVLDAKEKIWNEVKPKGLKPIPRAAHSAVSCEQNIFIFGGLGPEGVLNDFYSFNIEHGCWKKYELEELPSPRIDFAMCCVKINASSESSSLKATASGSDKNKDGQSETRTVIFIHGGMDTSGNIFDDIYIYFV